MQAHAVSNELPLLFVCLPFMYLGPGIFIQIWVLVKPSRAIFQVWSLLVCSVFKPSSDIVIQHTDTNNSRGQFPTVGLAGLGSA